MNVFRTTEILLHVIIIVGYFFGLFPFGYLLTLWFVIPLTFATIVLSVFSGAKTLGYNIANFLMSLLSLIPFFGLIFRVVGLVLSIGAINALNIQKR